MESFDDDAWLMGRGDQVGRYWGRYWLVPATNTCDFVLMGQDAAGRFAELETFRLADSAEAFACLRDWLAIRPDSADPHFILNARGTAMSRHGFARRLALQPPRPGKNGHQWIGKRITSHSLQHACALHSLETTGDIRKVSFWLGYASIQSMELYFRVDPAEKLNALAAELPLTVRT